MLSVSPALSTSLRAVAASAANRLQATLPEAEGAVATEIERAFTKRCGALDRVRAIARVSVYEHADLAIVRDACDLAIENLVDRRASGAINSTIADDVAALRHVIIAFGIADHDLVSKVSAVARG